MILLGIMKLEWGYWLLNRVYIFMGFVVMVIFGL